MTRATFVNSDRTVKKPTMPPAPFPIPSCDRAETAPGPTILRVRSRQRASGAQPRAIRIMDDLCGEVGQ